MLCVLVLLGLALPVWSAPGSDFADEVGQNLAPGTPGGRAHDKETELHQIEDDAFAPVPEDPLVDYAMAEPFSATRDQLPTLLRAAYNRVVFDLQADDEDHDGFLRAGDIPMFVRLALNPANMALSPDEETVLREGINQMLRKEGLLNTPMKRLHLMYLLRGNPLNQVAAMQSKLKSIREKIMREQAKQEQEGMAARSLADLDEDIDNDGFDIDKPNRKRKSRRQEL